MRTKRSAHALPAAVLVAAALPAHADPGLSSLEALLPFYVAAFAAFMLAVYVPPVWLTFRAKKTRAKGTLSHKKLLLLIAPAGFVGCVSVIGFGSPLSIVSGVFGSEELGLLRVLYWFDLGLGALFVYLAFSTYRRCQALNQ